MEDTFYQKRNKKKAVAAAMAGFLLTGGILGGAYAALNETKTDAGGHEVYATEGVGFSHAYHSATGTINKDVTMVNMTNSEGINAVGSEGMMNPPDVTPIVIENTGTIPSQFAFYVNPEVMDDVDLANPYYDETFVRVDIPVANVSGQAPYETWTGTLGEFLQTAFVSDKILAPGDSVGILVHIVSSTYFTWTSTEAAAPFAIEFETMFTANQITGVGTSPLYNYAFNNGAQRGPWITSELISRGVDTSVGSAGAALVSVLEGGVNYQNNAYTIPSEAIAGLTL